MLTVIVVSVTLTSLQLVTSLDIVISFKVFNRFFFFEDSNESQRVLWILNGVNVR